MKIGRKSDKEFQLLEIVSAIKTLLDLIKLYERTHAEVRFIIPGDRKIECGLFNSYFKVSVDGTTYQFDYENLVAASERIDIVYHIATYVVNRLKEWIKEYENSIKVLHKWIVVEEL